MPPIEETTSDLIRDYLDTTPGPDPVQARGRYVAATGTVANAADAETNSTYHLADIPAEAILHEDTFFDVENWGFAAIKIGTASDSAALVDQLKSAENIAQPIAIGDANHAKRFWEVLGLAKNPGGKIAIYAHAAANATGAGSMPFRIAYLAG